MRKMIVAIAVAAAGLGVQPAPAAAQGQPTCGGAIAEPVLPGGIVYWRCAVEDPEALPEMCGVDVCRRWAFTVPEAPEGYRLRVTFDHDDNQIDYGFRVRRPDGPEVIFNPTNGDFGAFTGEEGFWTIEAAFEGEALVAGTWSVGVLQRRAADDRLRFRALLEPAEKPVQEGRRLLAPNLVATPPDRFTFAAPAHPVNVNNPPHVMLEAGDVRPVSCIIDETVDPSEGHPTRCLRFRAGGFNIGDGNFDLRFDPNSTQGEMRQRLYYANGDQEDVPVGQYELHATHGHYHFDGMLQYHLLKLSASGGLEKVGEGLKRGYCAGDYKVYRWTAVARTSPWLEVPADCTAGVMGWSRGWGDQYPPTRQGQYVNAGKAGDGLFIVRSKINAYGQVIESDTTDNEAFAVVCAKGTSVKRLAAGQGPGSPRDLLAHQGECMI